MDVYASRKVRTANHACFAFKHVMSMTIYVLQLLINWTDPITFLKSLEGFHHFSEPLFSDRQHSTSPARHAAYKLTSVGQRSTTAQHSQRSLATSHWLASIAWEGSTLVCSVAKSPSVPRDGVVCRIEETVVNTIGAQLQHVTSCNTAS